MSKHEVMRPEFKYEVKDIRSVMNTVGLESGVITGIPAYIRNIGTAAYSEVVGATVTFRNLFSKENDELYKDLDRTSAKVKTVMSTIDFLTVKDKDIPVISGFKGYALDAVEDLEKHSLHISRDYFKALIELDDVISRFISDEDYRKSFKYKAKALDEIANNVKPLGDILSDMLSGEKTDVKKVSDVFGNVKSITVTADKLIGLNKELRQKDITKLYKLAESVASRVSILTELLDDPEEDLTKESVETVISAITNAANILTVAGSYYTVLNGLALTTERALMVVK